MKKTFIAFLFAVTSSAFSGTVYLPIYQPPIVITKNIVRVGGFHYNYPGGSNATVTFTSTAGNALVAIASTGGGTNNTITISDGVNTYVKQATALMIEGNPPRRDNALSPRRVGNRGRVSHGDGQCHRYPE